MKYAIEVDKLMDTLQHNTHFFINVVLVHLLPSVHLQSLESTHTSFEQSLAEFYIILLEERLQVALEMLDVGICLSLLVSKTGLSGSVMFKSGDCAGQGRC
jgi:hypothetical protein